MENLPKPAYVRFEFRPVENRERSIEAGHPVYEDVVYALITPAGTRDQVEKIATEWLKSVEEGVSQDRIPGQWLDQYREALKRFEETNENSEFGLSLKEWPFATPGLIQTCFAANLRTVEDLAAATEEAITRIGMGGRAWKAKAQAFLDTSKDTGAVAAELQALRQKNEELENRDKEREVVVANLAARLEALEGKPETPQMAEQEED